jgi:hypothetical protein
MTDTVRRFLFGIVAIGVAGLGTEMLLLEHYEDVYQLIPLVLAGAAAVALGCLVVAPGTGTVRLFQVVMTLFVLSGVAGAWLHFQVNMEFQLEMDPSLTGMALFRQAIRAKAPPALAPGAMIQLGLIGLACTYRHPALGGSVRL